MDDGQGAPGGPSWLDPGEALVFAIGPDPWFILLRPLVRLVVVVVVACGALWAPIPMGASWVLVPALVLAGMLIGWALIDRRCRSYVLTDRRAVASGGVLRRWRVDVPLSSVRHALEYRSIRERLFGLGTIGLATPGTDREELVWLMVASPSERLARVREAIRRAGGMGGVGAVGGDGGGRPHVFGLAGGIGSGKSEVARAFAALGCVVVDSDGAAHAALDREDVRSALVSWWGEGVIGEDGRVKRSAVASIVFRDAAERRRLEGLVHPIVRAARREAVERACADGVAGVVIDAPLLFEADLASECDTVIFVDAPLEVRERRVRETRGWGEGELSRRESAQMSLEEKRSRSDAVIVNDTDRRDLGRRVGRLFREATGGGLPAAGGRLY